MSASWWSWPETRDKFAEIHRERQTHAKNRGESLRRVWWGWEDREARESNTGVITAAESRPLADLGTFVTRTASPPSPPPEYLLPLPTCPLVPLWLSRHRKQQEFKLQTKEDPTWGEESTAHELRKYDRLMLDVDGVKKTQYEKLFSKRSSLRKGYRAWLLFKIGAVGDEEDNEMNEAEWYEIINLLKILFVMSSIFYSIVTSCSSLESAC